MKTKNNNTVSVVIPVFNQEKYLRKCLDSIKNQTLKELEVIIINDGSIDKTGLIIDEYCAEDKRFKKINIEKNRGAGSARNEGIRCATGKYIVFLDSDDWFHEDMLKNALALAKEHELDVCMWGAYEYNEDDGQLIDDNPHLRVELLPDKKIFSGSECKYLFNMTSGAAWNKMFSLSFLRDNNIIFSDTAAFNDLFMTYSSLLCASRISVINERYTYYRVNNETSLQGHRREHIKDLFTSIGKLKDNIFTNYPDYGNIVQSFKNYIVSCIYSVMEQSDPHEECEELFNYVNNDPFFASIEYCDIYPVYQSSWVYLKDKAAEKNSKDTIKISVVVPTYNDENTIKRCLDSLSAQSLNGLEFIIVDDCSIDATFNIIDDHSRSDSRFVIIRHTKNQSAFVARKDGVLAARGKYIMFCDADDYLFDNACEQLWNAEMEEHFDIIHYGTNVITAAENNAQRIEGYKKLINPKKEKLYGNKVFNSFIDRSFEGHLWNKIFYRELAVYAANQTNDRILPKGQDKYYYWIMAYYAKSYRGIPEYVLYNYCYGSGVEGKNDYQINEFEIFCKQAWTEEAINDFMAAHGADGQYADALEKSRRNLLRHTVKQIDRLSMDDKPEGIRLLLNYWNGKNDKSEIVDALQEIYKNRQEELVDMFHAADIRPARKIRTIGTYYHIYSNGGIQRVLSRLMQIWVNAGYNVVFFTDYINEDDYQLPEGVTRVILDLNGNSASQHYRKRGMSFEALCDEYNVDVMVYHEYFGRSLFWDMLLFKTIDIPFIVYYHNVFSKFMATYEEQFFKIPEILKLADSIVALSNMDKIFWNTFNGNVFEVKNPLVLDLNKVQKNTLDSKIIVWVGRLDELHKRFMEPIDILKEVLPVIPDAKLVIVGRDSDSTNYNRLKNRIAKLKLEDSVILCGYQKDVAPFYKMASVYLMTSTFEGYPMTLIEALSFGLPTVMYDLPYLTLLKNNNGVMTVKQGDRRMMASYVIRLLSDKEYRVKKGSAARSSLDNLYYKYDIVSEWNKIFRTLEKNSLRKPQKNDMAETIVEHFKVSFNNNAREFRYFNRRINELESVIESTKNSKNDEVRRVEQKYKDRIAELEKKLLSNKNNDKNNHDKSNNDNKKNDNKEKEDRDRNVMNALLAQEHKKVEEYEYMLNEIRSSFTYKIGRMLTLIPRGIRQVISKKPM